MKSLHYERLSNKNEENQTTNNNNSTIKNWRSLILILSSCIFIFTLNFSLKKPNLNKFESINGYFIQSNLETDPQSFNVYDPNVSFGLINKLGWKSFFKSINKLNQINSSQKIYYKVIFAARHGQGFHNLAETKYGTIMWDCKWSELNGDGNLTWGPDARLSEQGKSEVIIAKKAWEREISNGLPLPELMIVSPLSRAIETMKITGLWGFLGPAEIREQWRENIGLHTCDRRRKKSEILNEFNHTVIKFEKDFKEEDELWDPIYQETSQQLDIRIRKALGQLFNEKSTHQFISITAHSGVISSLLRVIGHRDYPTQTGGMIPLVVKASWEPSHTIPPLPGPSGIRPNCPT
ncbi:hypothetical protein CROQUDRAFT_665384 [Cronartium quercuum f. sp. fusiforme G11]|uniref:Phosphoglycerate mutase n=1 Tax=Cronartium quercuum f. sp. fusiforme G11 TaxID=708437 RepID=A0A9P6T602_9BASI|nr:hypothetical protein CROQUDRAFT_665384 [Cronartium quercuum f. sp. fusiforme G11]